MSELANGAGLPTHVIEVDDLSEADAKQYLQEVHDLDNAKASALYHTFGGRVGFLSEAATALTFGMPLEGG